MIEVRILFDNDGFDDMIVYLPVLPRVGELVEFNDIKRYGENQGNSLFKVYVVYHEIGIFDNKNTLTIVLKSND